MRLKLFTLTLALLTSLANAKAAEADTAFIQQLSPLDPQQSPLFTEVAIAALPSDEQMQQLVEDVLMRFDAAVKASDFSDFYEFVSNRWRFRGKDPKAVLQQDPNNKDQRITKFRLAQAFKPFMDNKVDLSPLNGKKMKLDAAPSINAGGVLMVQGRYDTKVFYGTNEPVPKNVTFKLEFVVEGGKWKLFGITVNLL